MFNFQKEVVLNSLDKATVVQPGNGGTTAPNVDPKVRFHDGGEYFAKYIVEGRIYETEPIEGKNAEIKIDAAQLATIQSDAKHIQIMIELGLDNDYRGDYGSALYYFRKPILIDVNTEGLTGKSLAKAYRAAIPAAYQFLQIYTAETKQEDFPKEVRIGKPTDEEVLLVAEDSYIKVRSISIVKFDCDPRCEGSSEEPVTVAEMVTEKTADGTETIEIKGGNEKYGSVMKNNVEFGTSDYLLHNLRLPTYANMRFTSPSAPEMPIQGLNYHQFSFAYCVPRGVHFGGMSVAGQTNHSTTLHTFFVPHDLVTNFKQLFKDIGITDFVTVGRKGDKKITILPDAFASSQDLAAKTAIEKNTEADEKLAKTVTTNTTKNHEQDTAIASKLTKAQADQLYQSKS